VDSIIQQFNL